MTEQTYIMRLPLGTTRARAAWVLLGINIVVYIVSVLLSYVLPRGSSAGLFSPSGLVLFLMGWKDNSLIYQGEYWRLLTAMFLHGSLLHIFFNGYALVALGPEAERIFGTARFLAIYFLAGLAGSVASYAFSSRPSVGASGAIFGMVGGLSVFFYTARGILGEIGQRQLQNMIAVIVINIFIGFSAGGVIDNFAHIGGLIGGALAGLVLVPRYSVDRRFLPPRIERQVNSYSWAAVIAMFIMLGILVLVIRPPVL